MAIQQKNNFSEIKWIDTRATGFQGVAFAKCRAAPSDSGAGIFEWSPTATAEDNSATVLEANPIGSGSSSSSSTSSSSSASPGRWVRQVDVRGPAHAEWFGARGDGSTDDRAPIQRCLNVFGRVSLLARTYCIMGPLLLRAGAVLEGQGMGKTIVQFRLKKDGTTLSAVQGVSEAANNAVLRNLTIDCGYNVDTLGTSSTRQAVDLRGENILIERVKAEKFGSSSGAGVGISRDCIVIGVTSTMRNTRGSIIRDCEITNMGSGCEHNHITCISVQGQPGGDYQALGGQVVRNRIHDLSAGSTAVKADPFRLRAIAYAHCRGLEIADNEISNFDGCGVYLPYFGRNYEPACNNDVVVRNNRMWNIRAGVIAPMLLGASTHAGTQIIENVILLTQPTAWDPYLRGIHMVNNPSAGEVNLFQGVRIARNYIRGDGKPTAEVGPKGILLELLANSRDTVDVDANLIETDDSANSVGIASVDALVLITASKQADVQVHGNRSLAGADLRLILGSSAAPGPYSTRIARFQAPAFDGRVGLAVDDFLGEPVGFALGWTGATTASGSILAQDGEAGHPGIVLLDTGSDSLGAAVLKYAESGIVLDLDWLHSIEFAAKRKVDATASQNYECRMGFMEASGNDGVYFKVTYGSSNDNVIVAVAVNGASSSSLTSQLQDKGTKRVWRTYRIEVGPAADLADQLEARFFVDGTYLGRIQNSQSTVCIPPQTKLLCGFKAASVTGSSSKGLFVDYFQHQLNPVSG